MSLRKKSRARLALLGAIPLFAASGVAAPDPETAAPPPSSAAAATTSAAPADPKVVEEQWYHLLELGRRRGPTAEREEVERIRDAPRAPWIGALAEVFLEEWRIKPGDSRLESPRRVWAPPLAPAAELVPGAKGLHRTLAGSAEISAEGKVLSVRVESGSGNDQVDFAVEKWAREGRWRPAARDRKYVRAQARWTVELR